MTVEQARLLEHFICSECTSEDVKKQPKEVAESTLANGKVTHTKYSLSLLWFLIKKFLFRMSHIIKASIFVTFNNTLQVDSPKRQKT